MEKFQQLQKYKIEEKDWSDMSLVDMKLKAETIVSLFIAIENTLAPHISPEESELLDTTMDKLLKYLDNNFINK